ncbi:hypothetical protein [Halorubrum sp. HHNYT27]|uniref:hypothetical protein n=1 Tax=Halorubrum sp. HHNYT27 TaxID=3402275 RepID=UPI003EBD51AD
MTGSDSPLESVVLDDVAPESIPPHEVRAALESERSLVRQRGAHVCVALAGTDVDRIRPFVDALGSALRDDDAGVRQTAASALQEIAAADPDAITGIVDDVVVLTRSDLPDIRLAGAELLAEVATERPSACASVVGELIESLDGPRAAVDNEAFAAHVTDRGTEEVIRQRDRESREYGRQARELLSNVLVAVADDTPAAVADHVDAVADLAATDDAIVRGAALDVLGALARESPESVRPVADVAVPALDAEANVVRARAVRLFGLLGDEAYVEALERVAERDEDDEIAAFADETAAFIRR